ncbi:MAG TPA: metalloregulator ArsR/SmtB family transcription factor [Vicinamibacterales bacterium]|nr:metalloregulator ArsR/SmtB family transcription factor [Vicinamibacterales bacterium]
MVQYLPAALDDTFAALADATRRAILADLARGEQSVTALAEPHAMTLPAIAKHLRVLVDAGLVETSKTGRIRRCRLQPAPLRDAAEWIAFYRRFWDQQLAGLEVLLHRLQSEEPPCPPSIAPRRKPSSPSRARSRRRASSSSARAPRRR